jgi:hypothetical protein
MLALELLEDRTLLSAGGPTLPTLGDLAPSLASSITDHLSSDLIPLAIQTQGMTLNALDSMVMQDQAPILFDSAGRVGVNITASDVTALEPALVQLGFQVDAALPQDHVIEGYLPAASLIAAAELAPQGLLGISASYKPMTAAVVDQGANVHQTDRVQASTPGYDGTGVRVGVISDSYNSLNGAAADIASGDLPAAGVTVLQDIAGGSDEGRAMLQIVHHLAPGATLGFATADVSEAGFAQNITNLSKPVAQGGFGANVVTDDVVYFDEPFFQDGIVAQAANNAVTNNNATYFSAAGNEQNQALDSTNVQLTTDPFFTGNGANFYNFNPNGTATSRQSVTISQGSGLLLSLQWDQPYYTASGVTTSLSMFLVRHSDSTVLASAQTNAVANQTPFQFLSFQNTNSAVNGTAFDILILRTTGPVPGRIKYVNYGSNEFGPLTFSPADNAPTITPHAGAANAMGVAAAASFDQRNPEGFTSLGPVTILFDSSGNRLASPVVRAKPDIAAVDGTRTSFFGQNVNGIGFLFFGTSAAAPHAAAIAALVKQANPSDTPAQVYTALKNSADPNIGGTPGNPNLVGAGLIDAYRAIFGNAVPASPNVSDGFESGVLGADWEVYNSGSGETRVLTDAGNSAHGTHYLALDSNLPTGFGTPGLSEAILHINANGLSKVALSFNEKQFGNEADTPMQATFTGHNNSSGVAFSVDGVTWFRLVSLTGPASTTSYQANTFDLSGIAAGLGLTLGSDVRIKFQRFRADSGQVTSAGFAFDDVLVDVPPTANPQSVTVQVNTPKSITLTGSANGDPFTFAIVANQGPSHGSLSGFNASTGAVNYTPNNNYTGPDSFQFTITDTSTGLTSAAASVSLTVVAAQGPTANPQTVTVQQSVATGITLTGSAPPGDAFTFQIASQPTHGALSNFNNTTGQVTYTPTGTYTGPDSFTFTVTDTVTQQVSSAATVTITVVAPPTANAQSVVVGENVAKGITLTGSAPNGDAFTFQVASQPAHGALSGTAPNLTYTPANNFTGGDSFTFTVTDTVTGFISATATVTITVVPPPTANAQSVVVGENVAKGITLSGSAPNGDAFTFQVASQPAHGALSGTAPNLTYTPANNFTGGDTFTFTVTDTTSGLVSTAATVTITVVPPPTANAQSVVVGENTAKGITLTGSAPNGDAFTFQVASQPAHGALSGTAPNLTYTPANNFTGGDSFTFTVTDTASGLVSAATTITITVVPPPTANPQSVVVGENTAKGITLAGSAPNGDAFTFQVASQPAQGNLSGTAPNLTYTPSNNFTGGDSFTFTVTDTASGLVSNAATVTITVVPPPTANTQSVTVQQNTAMGITLTGSAPNGDAFSFQVASQPAHGNLGGTAPNLTYTPANNFTGPDSFTFTVTDTASGLVSTAATVSINVVATPLANPQSVVVGENTAKGITLTGSAPNGDAFTFQVASQPAHGNLGGTAPNLTYTPANNFTGGDAFTFTVTDTVTGFVSSPATVTITVVPPPTANAQAVVVGENTAKGITLTGSAPNGDAFTFQVASQPANGALSGTAPNLTYTPANNFTGGDSFTFTVTDTTSGLVSTAATITITVVPPPTANAQAVTVSENTPTGVTLTGSAPNGDAFSFQVASQPAHGALSGTAPNLTYTPANNYTGPDSFTFTVTDTASGLVSAAATVSITVIPTAGPFTFRWNGSVSPDWFTAANWTDVNDGTHHAVPTSVDSVILTGGPFDAVLSSDATIANLQMSTGFLTINANLTDTGNYYQDMGFLAFGADADQLQVAGNFTRPGGVVYGGLGTVVLNGTAAQSFTDTSGHALPNLTISNGSAAGVTFANGNLIVGNALALQGGSSLAVAAGMTVTANGNFTDNGKLFLTVPAAGNATAPITAGGTLSLSASSAFDLTVGSPAAGNIYKFVSYAAVSGAGLVPPGNLAIHGNGNFTATPTFGGAALTVALTANGIVDNWTGAADTDWFNAANWTDANNASNHVVPGAADTAVIPAAANNPVLNAITTVGSLQLTGGTLTLNANLTVAGGLTDNGSLFLTELTPGNATAPLTVGGSLTVSASSAFDLTVGAPASGNAYMFISYASVTGAGLVPAGNIAIHGNGAFTATPAFGAGALTVTLSSASPGGITDIWTGTADSNWFNAANWTDASNPANHFVPAATDTAVIKGAPNDPTLNANAVVGNLQVSGGFLTLKANLTDNGNYNQDAGFVSFFAYFYQLTIDGNLTHQGGFMTTDGHGTVVLAGTGAQTVIDTSGHALPNVHINNTSSAGVTLATGSTLSVDNLFLADGATLNLSVPAPGNSAAPLVCSGALNLGVASHLNLAMGAPASGVTYLFIQYGSISDNGVVFGFSGQGGFTPTAHKNANSLTVTLA